MSKAEQGPQRIASEKRVSLRHLERILSDRKEAGEVVASMPIEDADKIIFYVSSGEGLVAPEDIDHFLQYLTPGHAPRGVRKSYYHEISGSKLLCYGYSVYDSGPNGSKPIVVRTMPNEEFVDAAYHRHQAILERMERDSTYTFSPEYSPFLSGIIRVADIPSSGTISS